MLYNNSDEWSLSYWAIDSVFVLHRHVVACTYAGDFDSVHISFYSVPAHVHNVEF